MRKIFTLWILTLIGLTVSAQYPLERAPMNPEFKKYFERDFIQKTTKEGHSFGLIPAPTTPVYKFSTQATKGIELSSYDLRDEGLLTSIKNQGNCGSCWTFATMASIESWWLAEGLGIHDLSEDNLNNCHTFDWAPCEGGNLFISAAMLSSQKGPMNEIDDPYSGGDDNSCPTGLSPEAYVTDIWWVDPDITSIKQALVDYGALYVSMYWLGDAYNASDYTYYYTGEGDGSDGGEGHAVTLVGWDDNKVTDASQEGAWIIKNSWGDTWGESGYFYISYYDAEAFSSVGVFPGRIDYDSDATVYGYDECGWATSIGYQDGEDLGLVKFTASGNQTIESVGTYAVASNTVVDIEIYDDFDGTTLSNKLGELLDQTLSYAGYYTLKLPSSIDISEGNDFYIKINYNTGTNYPIPSEYQFDDYSSNTPIEASGKCWVSDDGSGWAALGSDVSNMEYDLSIKAYVVDRDGGTIDPVTVKWDSLDTGIDDDLYDVHFVDENTGYVAGGNQYSGIVIKTANGGDSWTSLFTSLPGSIEDYPLGISFVDENTGYICGTNGFIMKTTNGGADWTGQTSGTSEELNAIQFVDSETGYCVGNNGTILKTTDGGSNWVTQSSGTTENLYDVHFIDGSTGYAGGGSAMDVTLILKTSDGGSNWVDINTSVTENEERITGIHFLDISTGYLVNDQIYNPKIFRTTDGGTSWSDISPTMSGEEGFNNVFFLDAATGFVVGNNDNYRALILATNDSGQTWHVNDTAQGGTLQAVDFPSSNKGFAVGYDGTVLRYTSSSSGDETLSADFSADAITGTAPLTVNFTDLSSGNANSWEWDFDNDGVVDSTTQNPSWEYTQAGTYTVSLTVGDGSSTDTKTKTDYITVDQSDQIISTSSGGDWDQGSTWTGGVVPTENDNVVIDGTVIVTSGAACKDITVNENDTLINYNLNSAFYLAVNGNLLNNGVILNNENGGLNIELFGDVVNNGELLNNELYFAATIDQNISMGENGLFQGVTFKKVDLQGNVVAGSNLKLNNCKVDFTVDGGYGSIVISEGSGYSLSLNGSEAFTSNVEIDFNGNELYMVEDAYLEDFTYMKNVVMRDSVLVASDDVYLTGDSTVVYDYLMNYDLGVAYYLTCQTKLINYGIIKDNNTGSLNFELYADIDNYGDWDIYSTILKGSTAQVFCNYENSTFAGELTLDADVEGASTYQWYKDNTLVDGETSSQLLLDPFTFEEYGAYYCNTDAGDSRNITLTGDVSPEAAFVADVTSGDVPLTVNFTDQSSGSISSWSWDFDGDGTEDANTQNPSFEYTTEGTYSVSLTVSDGTNSDTETKTDYITVTSDEDCSWDFASYPYIMNFEEADDFSDWLLVDANGDSYTWVISQDDGIDGSRAAAYSWNTAEAADDWLISRCFDLEADKDYNVSFYYKVALASYPEKLKVHYGNDVNPEALNNQVVDLGEITNESFQKSTTTISIGNSDTYYFGWHAYSDEDMYNLYVDSVRIEEVEYVPLVADFVADVTSGDVPLTVNFTDQSSGDISSWSWDFDGDGSEDSNTQNPSCEYTEEGTYTVSLTVRDGSGSVTETKNGYIQVNAVTAIGENDAGRSIKVYPNPSLGKFLIQMENNTYIERMEVHSYAGSRILEISGKAVSTNSVNIDLTDKPEGIYFLKLYINDNVITKKIIKY